MLTFAKQLLFLFPYEKVYLDKKLKQFQHFCLNLILNKFLIDKT